ncbi:MAG: GNAT family N-acetyltransferase [Nitrospinae bacterium]|nr:GNAT family N-acetyltransferase [Nitrospinota bacterium]
MSNVVPESSLPGLQVVDLFTVKPAELDDLWQHEVGLWRDRLLWDVSDTFAALRRVLERGGLPGKAVRVGARTVGYVYYVVAGHLGVISGFVVSPDWSGTGVGETLLKEAVDNIRRKGVGRIDSQFVSIDCPWLIPAFEREGFHTYWREFLRIELGRPRGRASPLPMVHLEPWQGTHLREAAAIMQAAYAGGADAQINELYRTSEGCQVVLENILGQGGCGIPIGEASAMACNRGRGIGFVVVTEIACRQGHLAQVAVLPEYQHRGVGRLLLEYSLSRLAELQFDTLSLIVSRSNHRALKIYQAMGFQSVLPFPVFVWER